MTTKWQCGGCGTLYEAKYTAEHCCPPRQVWICENPRCLWGGNHTDLDAATACRLGQDQRIDD